MPKPLFVAVLGWSGTGKTTLIVSALKECAKRGLKVAAAKRARHAPDIAVPGKDSTLFLEAGALASLYIGDETAASFQKSPAIDDAHWYASRLGEADIVFLEGAQVEGAVLVLVAGSAATIAELKRGPGECDILVTADTSLGFGSTARMVHPNGIVDFVDILEEKRGT